MIVDLFVAAASSILRTVIGAIPDIPVPSWLSSAPAVLDTVAGYGSSLSSWVPVTIIGPCLLAVLAAAAAGIALKLGRVILSLLTAGGGSAG